MAPHTAPPSGPPPADENFSIFTPGSVLPTAATVLQQEGRPGSPEQAEDATTIPPPSSPPPSHGVVIEDITSPSSSKGAGVADPLVDSPAGASTQPGDAGEGNGVVPEAVPPLSPEEEARMLETAERLKSQGNTLYGEGKWEEATEKYAEALEAAPPGAKKQRAVYLANMAACDVARQQYKEAVHACSAALEEDAAYVKAYMRRGVAHKALDDLDAALADAKKVVELDPGNGWGTRTVKELEPIVAERHEKLKTEMLGKLKDLGNTLLGKFGLSLDNFQAEKDPQTGGYSIKFAQGG